MKQRTKRYRTALMSPLVLAACLAMLTVSCQQKTTPLTPVRTTPLVGETDVENDEAATANVKAEAEAKVDDAPTPSLPDDVFLKLVGSTVRVITDEGDASGVTLGKDDKGRLYVLTVEHANESNIRAVDLFSVISPKYPKSFKRIAPVEVMAVSERRDLAVLRSVESVDVSVDVTPIRRKLTTTPKHAYSCGYSESKGTIPLPEKIIDTLAHGIRPGQTKSSAMWKTKVAQALGRSGGPLVDLDGSLIGVASGKDNTNGYYCHHSEIVAQLDELDLGWLVK